MSLFTYISGDLPFEELSNSHIKTLSVNQAIALGLEVDDFLLEPSFDCDEPDVILWVEKEENLCDLSIRPFERNDIYDDLHSEKRYFAELEWEYTQSRVEELIAYIVKYLLKADEVELSRVWLGGWDYELPYKIKSRRISVSDLTCIDIKNLCGDYDCDERITVYR